MNPLRLTTLILTLFLCPAVLADDCTDIGRCRDYYDRTDPIPPNGIYDACYYAWMAKRDEAYKAYTGARDDNCPADANGCRDCQCLLETRLALAFLDHLDFGAYLDCEEEVR